MPHSTSAPRLGDLERVVMEHLWEAATRAARHSTVPPSARCTPASRASARSPTRP